MPATPSSPRYQFQPFGRRYKPLALLLQVLLALLLLVGCNPEPEPEPPSAPIASAEPEPVPAAPPPPPALLPAAPTLPDPMTSGSYLSRHLPADSVAYLRLPNPWASLGDVVGRPSDAAYASVAWRQQLDLLKNAVSAVSAKDQWPAGLAEALIYIDGPVEMAVLSSELPLSSGTRLWLSAKMRSDDPAPIEQWLRLFHAPSPTDDIPEPDPAEDGDEQADTSSTSPNDNAEPTTASEAAASPAPEDASPPAAFPSFGAGGLATLDIGLTHPVLLRFDRAEKRLHALLQIGPAPAQPASVFAALDRETSHPARSHLEALDHSGRGLAAWFDPRVVLPHIAASEHEVRTVLALGTGWAFAVGTVDGHGQIALSVDGIDPELIARVPRGLRQLPVTSALNPHWAIALALPGAAEWEALRQWAEVRQAPAPNQTEPVSDAGAEEQISATDTSLANPAAVVLEATADPRWKWINQVDTLVRSATGISAATVFSRVGPELVVWQDSAGRFAALRVKDPDGFDSLLEYMSRQLSGVLKMRRWNGMDIHEFSFLLQPQPQPVSSDASSGEIDESRLTEDASIAADSEVLDSTAEPTLAAPEQVESGWADTLQRLRGRVYWVEEDQFLILAKLPQVLADRQFSRDKTTLQSWLKDDQARDPAGSIALVTAISDNLQRDSYHGMISVLQNLGDLLEVEVDPYAFPNADELRLPERGAVSARLGIDGSRLSLALSYEDSPAELLQGPGGLATVAAAGLLSTVALPAIADYRSRQQLRQALAEGAELRRLIGEYVERRQRWPRRIEDVRTTSESTDESAQSEPNWQLAGDRLLIEFSQENTVRPELRGLQLSLMLVDGQWQCDPDQSSVAERLTERVCAELTPALDDVAKAAEPAAE